MKAILEINGKQYPIEEGRYVLIDRFQAEEKASLTFDNVLFIQAGADSLVGAPYVEGAKVTATVTRHLRGGKIIVYKMRCKKGYRRKNGHRQHYTQLQINNLEFPGKEKLAALFPTEPVKETTKKRPSTPAKAAVTTEERPVETTETAEKPKKATKTKAAEASNDTAEKPKKKASPQKTTDSSEENNTEA